MAEATGLPVQLFLPHTQGGCEQIGARIAYDEIDMVLFFNDPTTDELDQDLHYITNLCDQHNVPFATNSATAEMLIHGLARGDLDWRDIVKTGHSPFLPRQGVDFSVISVAGGGLPPVQTVCHTARNGHE